MSNSSIHKITRPTFVIDKQRAKNNIKTFADKFKKSNTQFRPHFKTHQSVEVGVWFREFGINKISVSSVDMAWQFYQAGWKDISIAFPFNRLEMERINEMTGDAKINVLIEDNDSLQFLAEHAKHTLGIFIKTDCGYHRTGINVEDSEQIESLANEVTKHESLSFKGILAHFGNTYSAREPEQIKAIYSDGLTKMQSLKTKLNFFANPNPIISIGDTPSASIIDNFSGVDEMRPGNFVFYDWMQKEIGSCTEDQIAAIMACPVVAKHQDRKELIIHGGAVHFSKEKGDQHFGAVTSISKGFSTQSINGVYLKSLSQEHGIVHCTEEFFKEIQIGDLIGLIPIHSCLTANLMKESSMIV